MNCLNLGFSSVRISKLPGNCLLPMTLKVNEGIPFNAIKSKELPRNVEILTLEIILDKINILLLGLYKHPSFNSTLIRDAALLLYVVRRTK